VRFNGELKKLRPSDRDLHDFVVLALNTGARRNDILGARWRDIEWEREVWTVPFSKNGDSYEVPLLPAAVEVLEQRRAAIADDVPFVFRAIPRAGT
jgi:integrase